MISLMKSIQMQFDGKKNLNESSIRNSKSKYISDYSTFKLQIVYSSFPILEMKKWTWRNEFEMKHMKKIIWMTM